MRRPVMVAILATLLAVASGCCTAACPTGKLSELLQQNPKPTAELAALATTAKTDAEKQADPKNKVSCYRVAAVAAWQSGDDQAPVNGIADAGIAACQALPQHDADAPTDCTLIRVAPPMATQDSIARQLQSVRSQLPTISSKLPVSDFPTMNSAFNDLVSQFDRVSDVRTLANGLAVPPEVRTRLDRYRLIITCNSVTAMSLSGRCTSGATPAQLASMAEAFNRMGDKKQALIQQLGMTTTQVTDACSTAPAVAPAMP